jgi:hypothetical protein
MRRMAGPLPNARTIGSGRLKLGGARRPLPDLTDSHEPDADH